MSPRSLCLPALLLLLGACDGDLGKTCTLIGCTSGLQVDFQTATYAPGTWTVEAVASTDTRTCSVSLPLQAVDPGVTCQGDMQLGTSGSALDASQHRLTGVLLPDAPTEVTVTVRHDGQQVASQQLKPTYQTTQPNGPGCEPVCTQASATVAW